MKTNKTILILIFTLISISSIAKNYSFINQTEIVFEKVLVYQERIEGRHIYDYNKRSKLKRDYGTAKLVPDTISFNSKIKLDPSLTYTFEFIGNHDTISYIFGYKPSKEKEITLSDSTLVYSQTRSSLLKDEIKKSDHGIYIMDENGLSDIYFDFINETDWTIYAIYPRISDETFRRGTVLYHNPDRKIISGEHRKTYVISDRLLSSYNDNETFSFKFIAVDDNGIIHYIYIENISILDEEIIITPLLEISINEFKNLP